MKDSSRIVIIILGRPGSGKDTQAELLAKKFNLFHIVSSRLIRRILKSKDKTIKIENRSYNIKKERFLQSSGYLNTFTFVSALIRKEIKKNAAKKQGLILSASPRSKTELEAELPLFNRLYGKDNIYFFNVAISPQEVYNRNLKRGRKDLPELDTKKIIKKRLEIFNRYTLPMIKLLKKRNKIIDINGEQSIMKIHLDILKFLSVDDHNKNKKRN